jgi:hypothetical protein
MVIILHYQFALKGAFLADPIFRGVHFRKAVEIDERQMTVVWNVTPFSLMDSANLSETQVSGLVQGGKVSRAEVTGTVSRGGMLLFALKGLFYGIRLRRE